MDVLGLEGLWCSGKRRMCGTDLVQVEVGVLFVYR